MSTEQAAAAKPRILVVDDSRVIRVAAKKILKEDFDVLEAGDGEDAWEQLGKDADIALVISDLSMPYLDGMGLLQRMRQASEDRLSNMPMIIVTGAEDDDGAKTRAFAAGATDFISKPFDSVQLLAHTRSHVRLQKTTKELKETTTTLKEKPATDPFTGLANQRAFLESGQQNLAYAIRHHTELAILMFQVDGFDKIFVQQGKAVGGTILKTVTAALQAEIRREDIAARISMARFGLILPSANSLGAHKLAARVCARIAETHITDKDGTPLSISLSAGVVTPEITRESRFDQVVGTAITRLESALQQGNCVIGEDAAQALAPAAEPVAAVPETTPPVPPAAAESAPAPDTDSAERQTTADTTAVEQQPAPVAETDNAPSLDAALAQLARGDGDALHPQLNALMRTVLPLLEHWNHTGQHGHDAVLERIRAQLQDA